MMTDRPLGQKFSQVYLDRVPANKDGKKWRIRLAIYVQDILSADRTLSSILGREVGVVIQSDFTINGEIYRFDAAIMTVEIVSLLDMCTEIFKRFYAQFDIDAFDWMQHFNKTCQEENVPYFMDDKGGVHPAVDSEFQHNLISTVKGLDALRYRAALTAFSGIQSALDREDTRQALRQVFDTAENIVKMMTGAKGLDASVIQRQLNNKIRDNWDEGAAKDAANQMMAGFVNWVNAAHSYRHIEGHPDAAAPPMDLTILMISVGASYIRWLIDQDQQVQQIQPDPPPVWSL